MTELKLQGRDVTEELLAFAQDLVRIRSCSGEEREVVHCAAERMKLLGYDELRIDGFGNLLGRVGTGGSSIMFDSHLDTVAVPDESDWAHPPFGGDRAGGFLWGRGSVDMKSGAAASIYAGAIARELGLTRNHAVYVSCTTFEEDCDGENLRHLFQEFSFRPDCVVICEPSSNLIARGHKGKAQILIRTRGVSAHGSAPEKGVNAIYAMADIIRRVEEAQRALAARGGRHGTLVMSRISSTGASLNAVPSECEAYLDRRLAVGETEDAVRSEFDGIVEGTGATWEIGTVRRRTWTGLDVVYEPFHLAWELDPESRLARIFDEAYRRTFGSSPGTYDFWDFSTNAVATVRLGIPTIGFGPGEYKLAHMRDERCAETQIADACRMYVEAIRGSSES
ncbi:MAG TPA: YgeY family selenium metabolism-linked hydrolase [Rectinemataceae bacterium]|nr:YgeY family selenium metabolism-linked hydrolase [Rectinemataceae bacterium]